MSEPTMTYDATGRPLSYRRTDGTGWDYTYDANGTRSAIDIDKP